MDTMDTLRFLPVSSRRSHVVRVTLTIAKCLFPLSFLTKRNSKSSLVTGILVYTGILLTFVVLSILLGCNTPWLTAILGILLGLYGTGGILVSVLLYFGIPALLMKS